MRRETAALRERERLVQVAPRNDPAADRVLEREQAGAREVRVVGLDRGLDLREIERAVGAVGERLRLDAPEHRTAARLVAVGVGLLADDVLVAALAMAHQRGEVRLRPGREEQRGLEAEELRRALLELVHGRIVAEHVVADRGGRHRRAHRGRGLGYGVAAQVDDLGHRGSSAPGALGRKGNPFRARGAARRAATGSCRRPGNG
jgi:hypothetical protein